MHLQHTLTDTDGDRARFTSLTGGKVFVTVDTDGDRARTAGPFTRAQLVEALDAVAQPTDGPGPCGRSSCWKEDGHDGPCEPSGRPHPDVENPLVIEGLRSQLREEREAGAASESEAWARAARAEEERDEARESLRESNEVVKSLRSLTAREHLDAAWDAAHAPEDGMIPVGAGYLYRLEDGRVMQGGPAAFPREAVKGSGVERRLLDPPAPAPPEGSEALSGLIRDYYAQGAVEKLADYLALNGARVEEEKR